MVEMVSDCDLQPHLWYYILATTCPLVPLAWVRRIEFFAMTNLTADVCILTGEGASNAKSRSEWIQALALKGQAPNSRAG